MRTTYHTNRSAGTAPRYLRMPAHDRQAVRGHAWCDTTTGELRWLSPRQDPNVIPALFHPERF